MQLGRIMSMQLSINCRIFHCWFCCPVPWVATHSSRAYEVPRYWLQELHLMNYRVHVQHYANGAARASLVGRPVILFHFGVKWHNSWARVLFYYTANGQAALDKVSGWDHTADTTNRHASDDVCTADVCSLICVCRQLISPRSPFRVACRKLSGLQSDNIQLIPLLSWWKLRQPPATTTDVSFVSMSLQVRQWPLKVNQIWPHLVTGFYRPGIFLTSNQQ